MDLFIVDLVVVGLKVPISMDGRNYIFNPDRLWVFGRRFSPCCCRSCCFVSGRCGLFFFQRLARVLGRLVRFALRVDRHLRSGGVRGFYFMNLRRVGNRPAEVVLAFLVIRTDVGVERAAFLGR